MNSCSGIGQCRTRDNRVAATHERTARIGEAPCPVEAVYAREHDTLTAQTALCTVPNVVQGSLQRSARDSALSAALGALMVSFRSRPLAPAVPVTPGLSDVGTHRTIDAARIG